ncbi:Retrovirus-related Pol polyprotein from transposon gypsy [Eumeta japonica]|uniref:RNA-directed DNA polymerase n=1 Tax=Eumeta variegata TaxID=151549 RepID=A0A4C2AFR4_EUMVA|nr:Retrovirus-related Pol polyprotein from transposon gypsy [Eumeta japonica]
MSKRRQSDFDNNRLSLEKKPSTNPQISMEALTQQIARMQLTIENLVSKNQQLENRVSQLPTNPLAPVAIQPLQAINMTYNSPVEINLDIFKSLPEFKGNQLEYRSWREDVCRLMDGIKQHEASNRYCEALSIVKTKIRGPASDVLINHNTVFNWEAIKNRLDYTYADQRPLYVLQDELRRITQGNKTLTQYHDEINKSLTLITSKLSMSGYPETTVEIMMNEAIQEAVRVFKDGIKNSYIRATLYGSPIKDLEHAYAIARTIEHDNEHRRLNLTYGENGQHQRNNHQLSQWTQHHPTPDNVGTITTRNFNTAYKRPGGSSGMYQQPKTLRLNNMTTEDDLIVETGDNAAELNVSGQRNNVNIHLRNGLPCINLSDGNKEYQVLIDTGASHNYVKPETMFNKHERLENYKYVYSVHGMTKITHKQNAKIFGKELVFFETTALKDFDAIIGYKGIKELNAKIDLKKMLFVIRNEEVEYLKINYLMNDKYEKYKIRINELMKGNHGIGPLPFTNLLEATIRTITEDPIYTKQYPYPIADNEFVNKEVKRLLDEGIISKSNSPYNSPIWTVPKKGLDENGRPKRRMVVDFQKLNKSTIADRYPIPDISTVLQNLGQASLFTTLDLESGFHQIKIKNSDQEKTAFSVLGGHYEYKRMPFGLKNAPAIFQRCVDEILREHIGKFAYVYIDDVLIYSSSPEEHMKHIEIIIKALNEATLRISIEKSKFFQTEVEYLGHVVKHGKICTNPEKVEAIEKLPIPENLKELRGFLGMTGYYRKFVKNYASIAKPLTIHLRGENGAVTRNQSKKTKITLDQPAIDAFNKLKKCLKEQVELQQPKVDKPFEITTDASNIALGAVLSQQGKPIAFISRTLTSTEENYSTNEKELLAIIWALQKLRNYVYGSPDLTIFTDHQSLTFSVSDRNPNTKLKRWKNIIEEYGAKLIYKPGKENVVADALSRHVINVLSTTSDDTVHSAESSAENIFKTVNTPFNAYGVQIEGYKNNIKEILETCYWPDMKRHCKAFNKKCSPCLFGKYERRPTKEPLRDATIPTEPNQLIHMDIYYNENKTYICAIDKFSKYVVVRQVSDKTHMDEKMEEIIVNNYPNCTRLMTDNEPCLNTPAVKTMCAKHNIEKINTPIYRSSANGQIEREHGTITELSRILKIQNETSATEELFKAVKELNNTIHSVTQHKPSEVHFGSIQYDKEKFINTSRKHRTKSWKD